MSGNSRSSLVWSYFEISSVDTTRASCKICKSSLSRGGTGRKTAFNTSNLLKHLRVNHDDEWQQYKIDEDKRKPTTSSATGASNNSDQAQNSHITIVNRATTTGRQITIGQAFDNQRQWDFDGVNSRRIHKLVGEMIALDNQPFNIVNNEGKSSAIVYYLFAMHQLVCKF
jgi:hypothetical protein